MRAAAVTTVSSELLYMNIALQTHMRELGIAGDAEDFSVERCKVLQARVERKELRRAPEYIARRQSELSRIASSSSEQSARDFASAS